MGSIPDLTYTTKSTCSTAGGEWVAKGNCSDGSSTVDACFRETRVWKEGQGNCSDRKFINQTDCEATENGSNYWDPNVNRCEADGTRGVDAHDEHQCILSWRSENVEYFGASTDICTEEETGDRETWWDWQAQENERATTEAALTTKFIVGDLGCNPLEQTSSSHDQWTEEFRSLGIVNSEEANINLLSLEREKAIDVWIVNNTAYYSSFDTKIGKYLLNNLVAEELCIDSSKEEDSCTGENYQFQDRQCVHKGHTTKQACQEANMKWTTMQSKVLISDFEAYNLAKGQTENEVWADGLDFNNNAYQFGTINLETKALTLKDGLTGTLKTIVILPD